MDRCRCEDYAAALKKLKFFTVGTHHPNIIENYDKSQYITALKKLAPGEQPEDTVPNRIQQIKEMWCPYMTPVKRQPKVVF